MYVEASNLDHMTILGNHHLFDDDNHLNTVLSRVHNPRTLGIMQLYMYQLQSTQSHQSLSHVSISLISRESPTTQAVT